LKTVGQIWDSSFIYKDINYENFEKGHNSRTLWPILTKQKLCHSYPNFIGIMCRRFNLEDLKTMGGVWDTTFHQQPNRLTNRTPVYPLIFISWAYNKINSNHTMTNQTWILYRSMLISTVILHVYVQFYNHIPSHKWAPCHIRRTGKLRFYYNGWSTSS